MSVKRVAAAWQVGGGAAGWGRHMCCRLGTTTAR
jgi:hypothetical protein